MGKNEILIKMKPKFFIVTTVSVSMPFFKGQINVLNELFSVNLVSSPGSHLTDMGEAHSVPIHPIPMMREISIWKDFKSLFSLYKLFKAEKPTVVHGNTPKGSLLAMLGSWLANVPVRIYYVHGLRYQSITGKKRKLLIFMEKLACYFATDIIAVSHGTRRQMQLDKITSKKIQIIWNGSINGIDLNFFDPRIVEPAKETRIQAEDFVFGFVGRLVKDKGLEELVEAFLKVLEERPRIKLLIIGAFEEIIDLKPTIVDLIKNHPNIVYVGRQNDVRPFYRLMDAFVLPSYREGFGIVLIEAAAMQVLSIVSDISGCNEVVLDGETGLLVKVKSVDALREKMLQITDNPEATLRMREACRTKVEERYKQASVWAASKRMYQEIVESHV